MDGERGDVVCARDRIQARRLALVQDLQAEAHDLQAVQDIYKLHQNFGYVVGTPREQAGGDGDGEWMDER